MFWSKKLRWTVTNRKHRTEALTADSRGHQFSPVRCGVLVIEHCTARSRALEIICLPINFCDNFIYISTGALIPNKFWENFRKVLSYLKKKMINEMRLYYWQWQPHLYLVRSKGDNSHTASLFSAQFPKITIQ